MTTGIAVYLIGIAATLVFSFKVFRILGGVDTYKELAILMTVFSMSFFQMGILSTAFSLNARINLGWAFLNLAAGFLCFVALIETYDHTTEERPGKNFLFAGVLLLVCAAHLPPIIKNPLIPVSAVLLCSIIMAKGDLFLAISCLRRKVLAR